MLPLFEYRVRFKCGGKWHNEYFESNELAMRCFVGHLSDGRSSDVQLIMVASGCNQSK